LLTKHPSKHFLALSLKHDLQCVRVIRSDRRLRSDGIQRAHTDQLGLPGVGQRFGSGNSHP
jgi:hypothetical protein